VWRLYKQKQTKKSFANSSFLKPFTGAVCQKNVHRKTPVSQDALPSTGRTRAYFKTMRDTLNTSLSHPCEVLSSRMTQ